MHVARNVCNTTVTDVPGTLRVVDSADRLTDGDFAAIGIEPLNARSVILSALLGSHPPVQSAQALVALAELFGIRSGTIRTSLSRMVGAGDLATDDANYRLTGRLLERQREQDAGRRAPKDAWDGSWWTALVASDRRTSTERRSFRTSMQGARMGELRPEVWLRPANVNAPPRSPDVVVSCGPLVCDDVDDLVARLWPLDEIESRARRIHQALQIHHSVVEADNDADLPASFMISAATIRFLRTEPQLPEQLTPGTWTAPAVRVLFDEFSRSFDRQIRSFFVNA